MDKSYELKYQSLEKLSCWFIGRRDLIFKLLQKENRNSKILDVGCSGGVLIEFLAEQGFKNIQGIDKSPEAIKLCRHKGIKNVFQRAGEKTEFGDACFDIIIASDVLEHIENDCLAVAEWHRIVTPGGKLIVFVPAFNFLWGQHDEINQHYRRYSRSGLTTVLATNKFTLEKISYWNFILFLPVAWLRILQNAFSKSNKHGGEHLYKLNRIVNGLLIELLKVENRFLGKFTFPFGISLFAVARKIE